MRAIVLTFGYWGQLAMRATKRRRPLRRTLVESLPNAEDLAVRVRYVGSSEHKNTPSFAGQPRPRADASLCDPDLANSQHRLTRWLRNAIRRGAVGDFWEGDFPRYVWYKADNQVYEARLTNRGLGEYKGYPLERHEWPPGIDEIYG